MTSPPAGGRGHGPGRGAGSERPPFKRVYLGVPLRATSLFQEKAKVKEKCPPEKIATGISGNVYVTMGVVPSSSESARADRLSASAPCAR